ncbi:MAG: hypothetical protein IPK60_10705 [Sandaracinaceae bacterium]|jgi:hypothetical protein|nr:hypothetical protein [Sandaracinaceae bacterium]
MTKNIAYLTLPVTMLLSGCNGAFWGNLGVMAVTIGIFFGTLSLGRAREAVKSAARSTPSSNKT